MSNPRKSTSATSPKRSRVRTPSVFEQFHCRHVHYELEVPSALFDSKSFFKKAGIPPGERWSGVLNPRERGLGYHTHFRGRVDRDRINFTIEYYNGGQPVRNDAEPFADTIMQFLGSFAKEPTASSFVIARFVKPKEHWRSRFNLPFKVTMGESEVVIDGISLALPKNPFRAMAGFLGVEENAYNAAVNSVRAIEYSTFNIGNEIALFNDATAIFLEQVL